MASTNYEMQPGKITLRPASAGDAEFLFQVYSSTRAEELGLLGWSPAQQATFVRMQFNVRQRSYAATYPSAETCVVCLGNIFAGSTIVFRGPNEIRLVDISLLPEFRGHGVGGELIRNLISEANSSRHPLRLSVLRGNRAAHLYERLGFVAIGGDTMYCEMELASPHETNRTEVANTSLENTPHARRVE
jgi:ribosomal protein S18 acetylase RimI-like enzyme